MPTQARTIADIKLELDDILGEAAENWSALRFRRAINRAIRELSNKVLIPGTYDLSTAWAATGYAYEIPAWVDTSTCNPQYQTTSTPYQWKSLPGYTFERGSNGINYIRLQTPPMTGSARLLYYQPNTTAPTTDPLLNAGITAAATSLVTKTKITDIEQHGFIVIDDECIEYAQVTQQTATTMLNNLIRGVAGTTAAAHLADALIEWAVVVDEPIIYTALTYITLTYMHEMFLNESAARNQRHHQEMVAYYRASAEKIMQQYVSQASPRFTLESQGEQIN